MASLKLPPVINNNSIVFKADSGASKHYVRIKDAHALTNMTDVTAIRKVVLPNNDTIAVTKQGILPINPSISPARRQASVLPGLANTSLLSLGQLCDDNCTIALTKCDMKVYKKNSMIMSGLRNHKDGLWDVKITPQIPLPISEKVNVIIRLDGAKMDMYTNEARPSESREERVAI